MHAHTTRATPAYGMEWSRKSPGKKVQPPAKRHGHEHAHAHAYVHAHGTQRGRESSKRRLGRPPDPAAPAMNPLRRVTQERQQQRRGAASTDEDIIRNHKFIRGVLTGQFKVPGEQTGSALLRTGNLVPPIALLKSAMAQQADAYKERHGMHGHRAHRGTDLDYNEALRGGTKQTLAEAMPRRGLRRGHPPTCNVQASGHNVLPLPSITGGDLGVPAYSRVHTLAESGYRMDHNPHHIPLDEDILGRIANRISPRVRQPDPAAAKSDVCLWQGYEEDARAECGNCTQVSVDTAPNLHPVPNRNLSPGAAPQSLLPQCRPV